MKVVGG
jgi:hypothetical protein